GRMKGGDDNQQPGDGESGASSHMWAAAVTERLIGTSITHHADPRQGAPGSMRSPGPLQWPKTTMRIVACLALLLAATPGENRVKAAQTPGRVVVEQIDGRPRYTNRLINEKSPYLQLHAHNPVDWYSWGPEAFERARREDKPIFLSIGYS